MITLIGMLESIAIAKAFGKSIKLLFILPIFLFYYQSSVHTFHREKMQIYGGLL